jgi:thioredoxin 2
MLVVACANAARRTACPSERLDDAPKCGKCHAILLDGSPVELDAAAWCGPCKAMAPAFERVAAEQKTRVRFAKVDTERAQPIAARFAIRSIPTLILFREGREAARISGAMDARTLSGWLARELSP